MHPSVVVYAYEEQAEEHVHGDSEIDEVQGGDEEQTVRMHKKTKVSQVSKARDMIEQYT